MADPSKSEFKFCIPASSSQTGFDCIKATNAPTPMPTPPPPPPPTDQTGDVCRDEVGCKAHEIGTVTGCTCDGGRCYGYDQPSGARLGCNRFTDRCAPSNDGTLFGACIDDTCPNGLVCEDFQCMPGPNFTVPCSGHGDIGCPCVSAKCRPENACSSQTSRCIACPPGCKDKCAKASIDINATCAAASSCTGCKSIGACNWCGNSGCSAGTCADGSMGDSVCITCTGVKNCSGAGVCIGPDKCQCLSGFVSDPEVGCKPECRECTSDNIKSGKDQFCLCVREHIRCLNGTMAESVQTKCNASNVIDGTYAAVCPEVCAALFPNATVISTTTTANPTNVNGGALVVASNIVVTLVIAVAIAF